MPAPVVAGLSIVAREVAKKGVEAAIKKYGRRAVSAVYKADKGKAEEMMNIADSLDALSKDKQEKKENKTPPKKKKPNMAIRKGANNYRKNRNMA